MKSIILFLVSSAMFGQSAAPLGPMLNILSNATTLLPNPKFISAQGLVTATNTDYYTVPTGRNAFYYGVAFYNNGCAVAGTVVPQVKISGSYYRVDTRLTVTANTNGQDTVIGFLGVPGEIFSVARATGTLSCMNATLQVVEFDAGSTLKRALLTTFVSGDNTLYTVPSGKSAIPTNIAITLGIFCGQISYINDSGTRSVYVNLVKSGASVSSGNQFTTATSVSNASSNYFRVCSTMSAGDFLSINTNANTAGQVAWVVVQEF